MKAEYGEDVELPVKKAEPAPKAKQKEKQSEWEVFQNHDDFEGGFLRDDGPADGGFERQTSGRMHDFEDLAGGFFAASQEEPVHGDLTIDHGDSDAETRTLSADTSYQTPISLTSTLRKPAEDASDQSHVDMDLDDQEDAREDSTPQPASRRGKKIDTGSWRGRGRGRAGRSTTSSTRKRKSLLVDSSDEDDVAALSDDASRSLTPPPPTRSAPKRKAARKSDAQVKSHFFAEGSDGETDLTDLTDRASPKKRNAVDQKSREGRGRGRGRSKA